tara:strand:- start:280 stop:483 length:204 start_codon:yes stop_codon:yes gene_type:complete
MTGHWVYFFSGVAVGCTLVLLLISATTKESSSTPKKTQLKTKTCEDNDDWWKRGEKPPWEIDDYFDD